MGAGARPGGRRGRAALCMSWLSSPLWPPTLMAAITLECRVRSISCTASARSASVRSSSGTALSACARAAAHVRGASAAWYRRPAARAPLLVALFADGPRQPCHLLRCACGRVPAGRPPPPLELPPDLLSRTEEGRGRGKEWGWGRGRGGRARAPGPRARLEQPDQLRDELGLRHEERHHVVVARAGLEQHVEGQQAHARQLPPALQPAEVPRDAHARQQREPAASARASAAAEAREQGR